MLYPLTVTSGRQLPARCCRQSLSNGQHWIHCRPALTAMIKLVLAIMKYTSPSTQPSDKRNRVNANEVLLPVAARTRKKPATIDTSLLVSTRLGSISAMRFPNPREVSIDCTTQEKTRQICGYS